MNDDDRSANLRVVAAAWWTPDPKIVAKLPRGGKEPFINCSVCGGRHKQGAIHLDFVGHADLTRAFIEIDPEWQWEPVSFDEEGLPRITQRGGLLVLWARVTLLGKQMLAVGTCEVTKIDADKELVGDMLRNAGMRFGIFGALWSKTDGWQDDDTPAVTVEGEGDLPRLVATAPHGATAAPSRSEPLSPGRVMLPDATLAISQPDKPLVTMSVKELLSFANDNGITVSGTKSDIVRTLSPLVRAASGDEPWPVEGEGASVTQDAARPSADGSTPPVPSHPEPDAIPFEPTVFVGAATESGTARTARNSAAKAADS